MSANSGTSLQGINMSGMIDSLNRSIKNNNSLNYLMRGGKNDIPYAFMGIATIVIAGFTYVTYKDYANEVASGISDTLETIQSSELFIPSKDDDAAPFFSEPKEESQEEPKEEPQQEPQEDKVNVDVIEEKTEESKEEKEESKEEKEESKEEKPEEPGEKYKLGGTKRRRKRKRNTEKRKRKN